jgi:lipoate-protein ligase B
MPELWVTHLGALPYAEALDLQRTLHSRRAAGELPDLALVLEHPPVYTRGKRTEPGDLPMGEDWYRAQGIEVEDTDRGGRVTYHGPGQLVAYPIVGVERVADYVQALETAMVAALADEGVTAEARSVPFTGVWVGDAKIGSIGVRVRDGVSLHGLAVNVDNDLQPFEWIVPCGIDHVRVTSLARETGRSPALPCFRKRLAWRLAEALGLRQRLVSLDRLVEREVSSARGWRRRDQVEGRMPAGVST